jgi:urease accessory protein
MRTRIGRCCACIMVTDTECPLDAPALLRLLQLASPALPVGAFAYSQGLEWAVHAGWVRDEAGTAEWIEGLLQHTLARLDVPILARLHRAFVQGDSDAVDQWSKFLYASRETAELRAESRQIGQAAARLLVDLNIAAARAWTAAPHASFVTLFALAASHWGIPVSAAANAYLWTWTENQTAAAVKLVPLGQTAGQRLLGRAIALIPGAVHAGFALDDDAIGALTPGLALASSLHETQYSRLFRS